MTFCNEFSATNVGPVGHAALAAWLQENLSQTFDVVLREPLPRALLAILDAKVGFDAASASAKDNSCGSRF